MILWAHKPYGGLEDNVINTLPMANRFLVIEKLLAVLLDVREENETRATQWEDEMFWQA